MKTLTAIEFALLQRLLTPVPERGLLLEGSAEEATTDGLVEQGRAVYTEYQTPIIRPDGESVGRYDITPAGREALRLYPLMLAVEGRTA